MRSKIQDGISNILKEEFYNGKSSQQNMEIIDDRIYRQSTGSNLKPREDYDIAIYNYVAEELGVGVKVLKDFVNQYNIDVEGMMKDLRKGEKLREYMKRALRDGDERSINRLRWTYVGTPTGTQRRRNARRKAK